jgi:hypothetical protein
MLHVMNSFFLAHHMCTDNAGTSFCGCFMFLMPLGLLLVAFEEVEQLLGTEREDLLAS